MSVVYPTHGFSNIIIGIVENVKKLHLSKQEREYLVVVSEYNYKQSIDADLIYALKTQNIILIGEIKASNEYGIKVDYMIIDNDAVFVIPFIKNNMPKYLNPPPPPIKQNPTSRKESDQPKQLLDIEKYIEFNKEYRIAEKEGIFMIEKYTYIKPGTFFDYFFVEKYAWMGYSENGVMDYKSLENAKIALLAIRLKELNILKETETKYHYL